MFIHRPREGLLDRMLSKCLIIGPKRVYSQIQINLFGHIADPGDLC